MAVGAFGDAWIEFHGDMNPLDRDISREANQIRRDDRGQFKRAGEAIGDTMGEAASDQFATHAKDFGEKLQREVRRRPIEVKQRVDVDYDIDTDRLGAEIREAVSDAFAPGGPVDTVGRKFGLALGDAFGAGFGVSGRSALIPFIVILVGVIGALILAAVQAVNALIAILVTIPALLTAIALQVGVVVLAFRGLGTAITGAFAAKNAKELNEALKDLTPSAQKFVRTLLPLRDLFQYLARVSQEAFFANLGPVISELQLALGTTLGTQLDDLAAAMGRFARSFALVFASPSFQRLLDEVIPATIRWLDKFGPGFATFLIGLIDMANAAMPFFEAFGGMFANWLKDLGIWFSEISKSPEFQDWLDDMQLTLDSIVGLFKAASTFVASFMDTLNQKGGVQLIDDLATAFYILADFFQSEAGQQGMRGFLIILSGMIAIFTGLVVIIFTVIGAIQSFFDWITGTVGPAIGDFFTWLGETIAGGFDGLGMAVEQVQVFISTQLETMKGAWRGFLTAVTDRISQVIDLAKSIPGRIKDALGNLKDLLFNAGRTIVQSLINGVRSMFGALGNVASAMIGKITDVLPGSPAKEGPLSGQGYAMTRGQHLVQDLAKGIQMEIPTMRASTENMVNNIMFGPNAVSVGFSGVVPTPDQARITGAAAGQGILDQLAARDVRLAVRTL